MHTNHTKIACKNIKFYIRERALRFEGDAFFRVGCCCQVARSTQTRAAALPAGCRCRFMANNIRGPSFARFSCLCMCAVLSRVRVYDCEEVVLVKCIRRARAMALSAGLVSGCLLWRSEPIVIRSRVGVLCVCAPVCVHIKIHVHECRHKKQRAFCGHVYNVLSSI